MPVPNLSRVLRGWVKKTVCTIVTKTIVNHKVTTTETNVTLEVNKQPVPPQRVDKKPEEQRQWKWWNIIIRNGSVLLKPDDKIIIDNITYNVMNISNWTESGFQKYECVEDYT
ncbi:hypothetical protein GF396_04530 [Candidatus Pacearchaeota archaeon]|nr:hypothetical protein [Candidatus Pacearchaeota archaeon]